MLYEVITESNELQFAGAHNPLYYLSNNELTVYKGSRKGIGGKPLERKVEKDFENNIIQYKKGDQFFIFSDGLPDQVGGADGVITSYSIHYTKLYEEDSKDTQGSRHHNG